MFSCRFLLSLSSTHFLCMYVYWIHEKKKTRKGCAWEPSDFTWNGSYGTFYIWASLFVWESREIPMPVAIKETHWYYINKFEVYIRANVRYIHSLSLAQTSILIYWIVNFFSPFFVTELPLTSVLGPYGGYFLLLMSLQRFLSFMCLHFSYVWLLWWFLVFRDTFSLRDFE